MYVWGNGEKGQLGLKRQKLATNPIFNSFFENLEKYQTSHEKENLNK